MGLVPNVLLALFNVLIYSTLTKLPTQISIQTQVIILILWQTAQLSQKINIPVATFWRMPILCHYLQALGCYTSTTTYGIDASCLPSIPPSRQMLISQGFLDFSSNLLWFPSSSVSFNNSSHVSDLISNHWQSFPILLDIHTSTTVSMDAWTLSE